MATASVRLEIDDTHPLSCEFLSTETVDDHIEYIIKVQRGYDSKYSWQIKKRYNDFNDLYTILKVSNYELPLPPKKTFGNKSREFLSVRQLALQEFMDKILSNLMLANSFAVKKFLDAENYTENFKEQALAHVSMFFRAESNWQVIEPLNDIGWRFRKRHILLRNSETPNNKYILTWIEHGPEKFLKESELKSIFNNMTQLQHEYIDQYVKITAGDMSTIIIQKFNEKVISLRDLIYGVSKINNNYLKKYSLPKTAPQPIATGQIKQIGKKILLALQFIYSKGLFYGHLHSGNVLIDQSGNNSVRLTDLTNSLLGLPYFYRSYVVENRKLQNLEMVDVYGFGHVLYEMAYGQSLVTAKSKADFNDCPDKEVKSILDSILVTDVLSKTGVPTINQLLELPFFKNTNVDVLPTSSATAAASTLSASNSSSKLFTSTKVKEPLIKCREFIEKRLNDEQKALFKLKRHSEAEAKILSEEEIRRRRKEKKKAERDSSNTLEFPTPQNNVLSISTIKANKSKTNVSSLSSSLKSDSISNEYSPSPSPTPLSPPPTPVSAKGGPPPPPPPPPPASIPQTPTSAKSFGGGPPPPPPPPPPASSGGPPPPAPPPPPPAASSSGDRTQLLSSINSFSKANLKKAKTNDRSAPKV